MATKKAASTAKKPSTAKKTAPAKKPSTTTKSKPAAKTTVTTVKAVESQPVKAATSRKMGVLNITSTPLVAAMIAEFIGAFLLAALFITGQGQPILIMFGMVGIVLATGLVSGGYANPALTVAAWVTKRMNGARAIGYVVAQILGAMLALVLLNTFIKAATPAAADATAMMTGAPSLFSAAAVPTDHAWLVLLAEVIGSLIFGFVAASVMRANSDRVVNALTLGFGFFVALMVAGSAAATLGANAILNPAVAIALQAIDFSSVWPVVIYFVGTIAGTIGGFALYDYLRRAEGTAK